LYSDIQSRDVEGLEHDLGGSFAVLRWVQRLSVVSGLD
jgi:hypothetical protein